MSEKEIENVELEVVVEEVVVEDSLIEDSVAVDVAPEDASALEVEEFKPVVVEDVAVDNVVIIPTEPIAKDDLIAVINDAIGSTSVKITPEKKNKKAAKTSPKIDKSETVAVRSTRNVTWSGVGKVYNGYNIVTKEAAEKWLTRNHITLATPEEVAKEFGK